MSKYLLGILLGACMMLTIFFIADLNSYSDRSDKIFSYVMNERLNAPSDVKLSLQVANEKIDAINRRFDDLYKILGVIVTLILAINVGVFLRIENEVQKYFNNNHEKHLKNITDYEQKAGTISGKIEQYYSKIEDKIKNKSQQEEMQTPENNGNII